MNTSIRTIILSAAFLFAAISCQKEAAVSESQDPAMTGETIQVNIKASLGDLESSDGTKATATSVVRLIWDGTEKVQAYCGTNKIGTDLTVTPSENRMFANLSGSITTTGLTSGTSVITFVYNSGCAADGLTFDFSNQDANTPFVAYGTLVYDGTETFTNKMVEFKFATSVMKIAATNLGGGAISSTTISGINTKVTLIPDDDSETCGIVGSEMADITKTAGIDASSDGTRAIVTIGLVPDNNKGRNIAISQTGYTNKGVITSATITSSKSYTTPASLFPCGTLGTGVNAHDYVLINGTKWATMNLAVSESGKGNWLSVTVPGTTTPVQIGDYFQWAAHKNYTSEANSDNGLLIYTAFTNTGTGSGNSFTMKKDGSSQDYKFSRLSIFPYIEYLDKYWEKESTLGVSDDVANILWADPWRMPTSSEIKVLKNATYWKWDSDDKGYYVYAPQSGDAGKKNEESTVSTTYNKSDALLFFPAAGYGSISELTNAGSEAYYWSSTLKSVQDVHILRLNSYHVDPTTLGLRSMGYFVRPVAN